MRQAGLSGFVAVLLALWACSPGAPSAPPQETPPQAAASSQPMQITAPARPVERLRVKILATIPHDTGAYTQGLVWSDGALYESAGQYGESSLRQVDPKTGQVLRSVAVAPNYFAEGLARVGDRLVQLTWQEGVALLYDLATFERRGELPYSGEGWGLCHDGRRLIMSDGSDALTFRDPATFAATGRVNVTLDGAPVPQLNELECVDGAVYANVYTTEEIVRIDPETGHVTTRIDASGLLTPPERMRVDVLNGIAYKPETKTFLLTGKNWPKMFEVTFEPAQPPPAGG
jgi:glutamine cyclotransferase